EAIDGDVQDDAAYAFQKTAPCIASVSKNGVSFRSGAYQSTRSARHVSMTMSRMLGDGTGGAAEPQAMNKHAVITTPRVRRYTLTAFGKTSHTNVRWVARVNLWRGERRLTLG